MDDDIHIIQDARIEKYFKKYSSRTIVSAAPAYVYRVQLISAYKRNEAESIRSSFRSRFPGHQTFLNHNGVQYIVTAGAFRTKGEADAFVREIRPYFPSSFAPPTAVRVE